MGQAEQLVSFWGGPVTWVERLCVASMRKAGHPLTIYSYEPEALSSLNLSAKVRDAREIVEEGHPVHRYREARIFPTFANLFRVELQRQSKGIWVDLDCYMVKTLQPKSPFVFGYSSGWKINNAVLGLAPGCPMIEDYMRAITAVPLHMPWASFGRWVKREVEILMGRPEPAVSLRTNIGPRALTYFAKRHGLMRHALPRDVFYPVENRDTQTLVDPDDRLARSHLTEATVIIHLWRGRLKRLGALERLPLQTSFLGSACRHMGI